MSVLGNFNLAYAQGGQYLTVGAASSATEIKSGVRFVDLIPDTDCWVNIGKPGATPTAAAPGAEKTDVESFFLPADVPYTVALPPGNDANAVSIAAIQDSAAGTLRINYRSFV